MPARGENPFEADRIDSRSIGRVGRLEHDECRHRVHRKLEASAKKAGKVRLRQYPSIANAQVPDVCIAGAAGNRVSAARPYLELVTAFFRAILGECERSRKKNREDEDRKKTARIAMRESHKVYLKTKTER